MERNGEAKSVCNIELMDILDYYDVLQDVIIIEYYDVPQLFVAKFKNSEAYLVCMLENIDEIKGCMFLGVKVTKARLNDFYHKEIDLRSIFTCPEFDRPFFKVTENGCEYVAEWIPEKTLSEEELPEKDYYFEQ